MAKRNIPIISDEDRRAALERAMEARRARAKFKQDMHAGSISIADAIAQAQADEKSPAARILVRQAIMTQQGYGSRRTEVLMDKLGIADNRRLRGLGKNQAAELAAAFDK